MSLTFDTAELDTIRQALKVAARANLLDLRAGLDMSAAEGCAFRSRCLDLHGDLATAGVSIGEDGP